MKCYITMSKQGILPTQSHMRQMGNALYRKRHKNACVKKINAFFMLDALIGFLALFMTIHMFLSVIQLTLKSDVFVSENMCDSFYISMKIQRFGQKWDIHNEHTIATSDTLIEREEDGKIVKKGNDGGYEYLGLCPNVEFRVRGEEGVIVFLETEKEEEAVYMLTQKKL